MVATNTFPDAGRPALRRRLLDARARFVATLESAAAVARLVGHLRGVLASLEPGLLGAYWAMRSEFNAVAGLAADGFPGDPSLALPFTRREPRGMEYRRWNGRTPAVVDDFGIPTGDGEVVVPDVLLVPCVGFTAEGFRIGYGGGFFDRWLAAHPGATTVGVAWSGSAVGPEDFTPMPHDRPLTLVVTEDGVVS